LAADYAEESATVNWEVALGTETLNIDPQLLLPGLLELFANAFRHGRGEGPINAVVRIKKDRFVFTLTEPKKNFQRSTERWGREPLRSLGQGHYGLGLHRTRAIIEAHGGDFGARYDEASSSLISTVTLPLAPADA